ncbi:hypothetical protein [Streptomyces alanosinicus]|nr:hypothetical protein [Streptomyces alanosinicus]
MCRRAAGCPRTGFSAAIAGRRTVDRALANAQLFAEDVVEGGGYKDQPRP